MIKIDYQKRKNLELFKSLCVLFVVAARTMLENAIQRLLGQEGSAPSPQAAAGRFHLFS